MKSCPQSGEIDAEVGWDACQVDQCIGFDGCKHRCNVGECVWNAEVRALPFGPSTPWITRGNHFHAVHLTDLGQVLVQRDCAESGDDETDRFGRHVGIPRCAQVCRFRHSCTPQRKAPSPRFKCVTVTRISLTATDG